MSSDPAPESSSRGRGRGKNRGGLGKYLRARGRGRGFGRPAEFSKRSLLDGEGPDDLEEDEEAAAIRAENARKYGRRQMDTNADRYQEEEPELGSDGEPILQPEVDLSGFLERQREVDPSGVDPALLGDKDDDVDVDHSLAHLSLNKASTAASRKGKATTIEWDDQLEEMLQAKEKADANRDFKTRFRARSAKFAAPAEPTGFGSATRKTRQGDARVQAPPLPLASDAPPQPPPNSKQGMEDFLDDLLT